MLGIIINILRAAYIIAALIIVQNTGQLAAILELQTEFQKRINPSMVAPEEVAP